ncbi:oligoendopeptidase F [Ammoniphilus oxalaticus]|nr:oligoendopeptidase F [Ammoniphilus oxalaticus]
MTFVSVLLAFSCVFTGSPLQIEAAVKYETREEIPTQYKWRMEDLYSTPEAWKEDLAKSEQLAEKLSKMSGKLDRTADRLKDAIDLYVDLNRTFEKAYAYATLSFHTNKADSEYQQFVAQAGDVAIKISEKTSFFTPELLAIPVDKMKSLLKDPKLADYHRWIQAKIDSKDHTLPKEMEQVLARSGVLAEAPGSIFGMLTKDMTYPTIKDESGKDVTLTPSNYASFIKSENREVRRRAYDAYYRTMLQFQDTFAQVLTAEVKKNVFYSDVRKYPTSRQASLESNQIPISVYDNLINSVNKHLPELHRYIDLKKKVGRLDKLRLYDLYVPFTRGGEEYIPFEKAKQRALEGLGALGDEYNEMLKTAFNERWIDVYHTPGKRAGAYQWGAYDTHPFILLNYQGTMDDVYTLAHELGHAAHTYFSNKQQPYLNAGYPIFTAEVASTTNEALLFEEMYKQAKTKQEKIKILNQRLEDYTGTLFLQTMFAEFEQQIHEKIEKGEGLTAQTLKDLYGSLMQKYFGPSLEVDEAATLGWARIPHFYRNYYVYQYATGFAAANAFAQQMKEVGKPAVERYLNVFLAAGDSDEPIAILKAAGVDMTSAKVMKQALQGFSETLDELEKLLQEE